SSRAPPRAPAGRLRRAPRPCAACASPATWSASTRTPSCAIWRARSAQQIAILCERLGFVGTDRSLDALGALAGDHRGGVPESAIAAIGHIGTDRATSMLLELEGSPVVRVRQAAIAALGRTGQERARERLMALAVAPGDPQRAAAIRALGEIGGDGVVELLGATWDRSPQGAAAIAHAAATTGTPVAERPLSQMARPGDARVRAAAIAALPPPRDAEGRAMLMELCAAGDAATAAAAARVLGEARAAEAVPLLIDV